MMRVKYAYEIFQAMGVASNNFGYLLIPIILRQIPHNLVVEFLRKKNEAKTGDVNELMNFIKFEFEPREAVNAVPGFKKKTQEIARWEIKDS